MKVTQAEEALELQQKELIEKSRKSDEFESKLEKLELVQFEQGQTGEALRTERWFRFTLGMMVQHYAGRVLVAMGGGKSREVKVGESLKESSREKQLTSEWQEERWVRLALGVMELETEKQHYMIPKSLFLEKIKFD